MASSEESSRKKIKLTDDRQTPESELAEDLSAHTRINSFDSFKLGEILSDNKTSKSIFVEGVFESSNDKAVILLDKSDINKDTVEKLLNSEDLALNLKLNAFSEPNVVNYACYPKIQNGADILATVICPATEKHLEKYRHQPMFIVNEDPEAYKNVVLPHIESQKFSLQWVYNILEHQSETERIVYEDPDKEIGFVLLPDLKWNDADNGSIYLIAICMLRNLKSLRDLTGLHLPLLNNIKLKGLDAISKKYNIAPDKMRVYLHYQPSYYHLHVHFVSAQYDIPGSQFEKAHLLDTVINNIELSASYYQNVTLTYLLKENDTLFQKLKHSGYVDSQPITKD